MNIPSRIETERIYCEKIHQCSIDDVYSMFKKTKRTEYKYISIDPINTIDETEAFINDCKQGFENEKNALYLIYVKKDNEPIGFTGFWNIELEKNRCEIGIFISQLYWGYGYATECLNKVLSNGLERLDVDVIRGVTSTNNIGAISVCENVFGKSHDGVLPNEIITKNGITDAYQFYKYN